MSDGRPSTTWLIIWLGWSAVCGAVLSLAGAFLYLNPQIPDAESYRHVKFETPLRIYSEEGALIAEFGQRRVIPVQLEDVPPQFVNAVLNTEDKRFYSHHGIDWISLVNDTRQLLVSREIGAGASTITMQLARNISFSLEQTFIRKFKEMLLALKIERELTKDEILELYLNVVPFGNRAYGAQAAAHTYYGRPLDELELPELAMLAGIPQAPSIGNPVNGPQRALERRNLVLYRMYQEGSIDDVQYRAALGEPITASLHRRELDIAAPYVGEWVRRQLLERFGPEIYSDGYEVVTTIDARLQEAATHALREGLLRYDRRHGYRGPEDRVDLAAADGALTELIEGYDRIAGLEPALVVGVEERSFRALTRDGAEIEVPWELMRWARPFLTADAVGVAPLSAGDIVTIGDVIRLRRVDEGWALAQQPEIEGALVALSPQTGGVRALAGGFDFYSNQYNHALQAARQPGSVFKPFVFSAALERGYGPASIFLDAPLVFDDDALEAVYRPRNSGGRYGGLVSMREALYRSINLVAMRVLMAVGASNVIEHSERFGFDTSDFPRNTQLAIGGGTMGVTPMRMASGFAVFANGGYRIEPNVIKEVRRLDGEVVLRPQHPVVCPQCPSGETELPPEGKDAGDEPAEVLEVMSPEEWHEEGEPAPEPPRHPVRAERDAPDPIFDVAAAPIPAERSIDERNAYIIDSMLKDALRRGTGTRANRLGRRDIAGKTGTTDEADTWFAGYHEKLVATVWAGFSDNRPVGNDEYGSNLPLPIWIDFMETALAELPESTPTQPPGIVTMNVDPQTGELAEPSDEDAVAEYFFSEYAPEPPSSGDGRSSDRDHVRPVDIF